MPKIRPRPLLSLALYFLINYAIFLVPVSAVWFSFLDNLSPAPLNFSEVAAAVPTILLSAIIFPASLAVRFVWQTRHRVDDLYRYSLVQWRFFVVGGKVSEHLEKALIAHGYETRALSEGFIECYGVADSSRKNSEPLPVKAKFFIILSGGVSFISLTVEPVSLLTFGSNAREGVYLALESLVKRLNWGSNQVPFSAFIDLAK